MRIVLAAVLAVVVPCLVPGLVSAGPLLADAQPAAAPGETGSIASPPAAPKTAFEQRLDRLDQRMAEVKTLRASFEQRKKTALLKKPLASKGSLRSKGDRVLWETREPRASAMLVAGTEVRVFYPDDKLVEVYPLEARFRDAAGGPLPRLPRLREAFDLAEIDPRTLDDSGSPAPSLLAIRLTPRSPELKRHLTSVRVLIDERVPAATRVVMTDPDGEETDIRFTNVRINADVSDDLELRVPPDARVSYPVGGAAPEKGPEPRERK